MRDLKEGVSGGGGIGSKREGKVVEMGHSVSEAMNIDTAGQLGAEGTGKHNLKEGNHNKGGGKFNLQSGTPQPKQATSWKRT